LLVCFYARCFGVFSDGVGNGMEWQETKAIGTSCNFIAWNTDISSHDWRSCRLVEPNDMIHHSRHTNTITDFNIT
jgi:hypothetical protein